MDLLTIVVTLALIGLVTWAIVTFIPMPAQFKTLIIVVALVVVLIWLLQTTGLLGSVRGVRVN